MSNLRKRPRFNGPIEGYVKNFLVRHYWRVEASMQYEDCTQEAYITFLRVQAKYPEIPMGPHFMALFKRAWTNQFHDFANEDTQLRCIVPMPTMVDDEGREAEVEQLGSLDNDGPLATKIRQAPPEVRAVLSLFLSAPSELLDAALVGWRGRTRQQRNGGSERVCRLLGIDPSIDVLSITEDYLTKD